MVSRQIHFEVIDGKGHYNGRAAADWIPTIVEDLVAALDPVKIVLFGSMARGDESPDSDLDVLIVVPHIKPGTKVARCLEARRAVTAPVPLDLLMVDTTELAERGDLPGVLRVACREGKILYARPA